MLGAIIGDTVGSVYEFDNIKTVDFPLFVPGSRPTDDSVMTMAVADWLTSSDERTPSQLEEKMVFWGYRYPNIGYGPGFRRWLFSQNRRPYNSYGNGSAMRCSACGWMARNLEEALDLGKRSAEISHNHPEGIKGAQATSAAIFMALHGAAKDEIRSYIAGQFGYDLSQTCDQIRPDYTFDVSCQGTVPAAITAFLESQDFESAIRLAVSLGGDCDTLTCITGGIAQAFYKNIPMSIVDKMHDILPDDWWEIIYKVDGSNVGTSI